MSQLDRVAKLNPPLSASIAGSEAVNFASMSAVSAETGEIENLETRPYKDVSKGYTPFKDGDVLVAKITPCFENGKIAQAKLPLRYGFGSTEFHVVRPNPSQLHGRYAFHFLRRDHVRICGERRMTGSAGQRRVPENFLAKLEIPLPPLAEQRRIAAMLDQADGLRAKRRQTLAELNILTQSIFHEMFGRVGKDFPAVTIEDGMEAIIDYRGKSPVKTFSGIPLITARVVKGGKLLEPNEYIAEGDYDAWMRRGLPRSGDVLFTSEAPLGEVAQLDGRKVALAQRLLVLRGNPELFDNTYVMHALTSREVRAQIDARATGSTVRGIRQKELRKVRLPAPPIELQQDFGRRIAKLHDLEATHRTGLADLDNLFGSIQQRAFRGEL